MNEENTKKLVEYIRSLKDFQVLNQPEEFQYENFGAVILDCVLQAGLNYKNVVEPRIKKYIVEFDDKKTLADFKSIVRGHDLSELINFKNQEKIERVSRIIDFFEWENLNTVEDLRVWLGSELNSLRFKTVKGVGPKTADYIKMLVGIQGVAIDVNLIRFLNMAGVNLGAGDYYEAKEVIEKAAKLLNLEPSVLDYSIWHYINDKGSTRRRFLKISLTITP